jgi:hypothetical protein
VIDRRFEANVGPRLQDIRRDLDTDWSWTARAKFTYGVVD